MNKTENGYVTAYPLAWPAGWDVTDFPKPSLYASRTLAEVKKELTRQVKLLGGKDLIISSNIEIKQDGSPKVGRRQPEDKGVAIYFDRKGIPIAMACDKWNRVEDNIWALCLTIEAMRQIERSGASELLDRAFRGFDALPAPAELQWWDVLGVTQGANIEEVKHAWRDLVRQHHPDAGGSREKFEQVQAAYDAACKAKG